MIDRLHIVDGTYELFRAHFSKRPSHTSPDGKDLKATTGLISSLIALLHDDKEKVTHIAVAFDNPIRSFRNDLFAGYKTEEGVPPELLAQFDAAEEATAALGVKVWRMVEFEADDGMATGAAKFHDQVKQVRLMTPDKDVLQCVNDAQIVVVDRLREKVMDEPAVRTAKGVAPESIPDLLALIGDTADGIPGLKGWGEKSAAVVLAEYRRIEEIPEDVNAWKVKPRGAEKLSATLNDQRDDALLYRKLATLRTDAPISKTLKELEFTGVPREKFSRWCDVVASTSLKARPSRWS